MQAAYELKDIFRNATGGICYGTGWNGTAEDTESCSGQPASIYFGGNPTLTHHTSDRITTIAFNLEPNNDGSDVSSGLLMNAFAKAMSRLLFAAKAALKLCSM